MKWLTLDYIKQHSRICHDAEDDLLELYATSAEETILNLCNRTEEDILQTYGEIPAALKHATLLLVDVSYQQRASVTALNLYTVPYSFDLLVKPYMILADNKIKHEQ